MSQWNMWVAYTASEMVVKPPPSPWIKHIVGISSLSEVGYFVDTDLLLVISYEGRGLFDCLTGELLASKTGEDSFRDIWRDHQHLTAKGIGPIENEIVHLAGEYGGGLRTSTDDGWKVELISPNWPLSSVVLCSSWSSVLRNDRPENCTKVGPPNEEGDEIVAFGFSQTGKSLVVATRGSLEIFSR